MPPAPSSTRTITADSDKNLISNEYPRSALHQIYVYQILSQEETNTILQMAQNHNERTNCWSTKDTERHTRYSTADFCVEECAILANYLQNTVQFETRMWNLISNLYDIRVQDLQFQDLFCAHYRGGREDINEDNDKNDHQPASSIMDHLALHRDGSIISFTIVLSDAESYTGGGTVFDALKNYHPFMNQSLHHHDEFLNSTTGVIRVKKPGQGVIHCGKALHGAHLVTSGSRTTLTGFVDVNEKCVRPNVISNACREFGRQDQAAKRLDRQIHKAQMEGNDYQNDSVVLGGWRNQNIHGIYRSNNHFGGFIPAFQSAVKRGNPNTRRLRNLEVEDTMLYNILLSEEEKEQYQEDEQRNLQNHLNQYDLSSFGDITIL